MVEVINHADVVEIIDSCATREPQRLSAEMLLDEDAVAGNKMVAFVEMKVGCCSLWRRW